MSTQPLAPPARRETITVVVLSLSFALICLDRYLIATLFPVIAKDLQLSYGDIGTITGALAISWGLAALVMGNLSDRIGRKTVMVTALVVVSLLFGASGLATGLASMVLIRTLIGFADGAYTPASITETLAVSQPHRRGRNLGLQQMTALLFGLGFAPLLIPSLLDAVDWRWIFLMFAVPGLLLAWLSARVIAPHRPDRSAPRSSLTDWGTVVKQPNVRLAMALMLIWLTCLVTITSFLPSYMLEHLGLSFAQMGTVMSSIGFGSALGTLLLPWLSDRLGRKNVMILGSTIITVALVLLSFSPAVVAQLYACLFFAMFGILAMIALTVGPLCTEAVAPTLAATASGVVIAVGELFGGGVAPILAGYAADRIGIEHVLWMPIAAAAVATLLCTQIRESQAQPELADTPQTAFAQQGEMT